MVARAKVRFLADDIWDTPEDGNRYEVIDGQLYMTPPPGWSHQVGVANLLLIVGAHVRDNGLGHVVPAPVGVKLDDENGLQPDLVYVSNERASIITERGVMGAPDLVVEVLSPSTRGRDLGVKLRRYAAAGIPHYWIMDRGPRELRVLRLGPAGCEEAGRFLPGSVFEPDLFPGLRIPISELWE